MTSSPDPKSTAPGAAASAQATAADQPEEILISLYQSSKTIYAKAVNGLFSKWRWAAVWITQIVFYGLPWLEWNARQAILFDLEARRFYIFGLVLYPQDFIYLTGLLVISALALFLFTAVAGRLWCGYACPVERFLIRRSFMSVIFTISMTSFICLSFWFLGIFFRSAANFMYSRTVMSK